ncbi:methyl-accepting chemotaxis protein [Maritalea porphyrae]|uniref:methyl-accepting chemotaxis protein n=1 Tax=Maritalea porphyrae TaxID=880732 RepID=UPI0022AFE984|nr:methyl-accepting chemotaxis protein [Maritalea porphyrae]MCZ4271627.1 methyl-accepting chemotaxis protein [Maritalea porphyrae]
MFKFLKLPTIKISQKLPMMLVGAALFVGLGVGLVSYSVSEDTVNKMAEQRLSTIASIRAQSMTELLENMKADLLKTAGDTALGGTLGELRSTWEQADKEPTAFLQEGFITNNPHAENERHLANTAKQFTNYDFAHSRIHPSLATQAVNAGYKDILLISADGVIAYSVFKKNDFATRIEANSPLDSLYKKALELPDGEVAFSDFAPYAAYSDEAASFIGAKVVDAKGNIAGVLAFGVPIDTIANFVGFKKGLGETGETLLVGADGMLRVDSSFTEEPDQFVTSFEADAIKTAIEGEPAQGISSVYRDQKMHIEAVPVQFADVKWAMVAVESFAALHKPVDDMRNMMLMVGGGTMLLAMLVGLFFSRSITGNISNLTNTMRDLADGDLDVEVRGSDRGDELGEMARAVEIFRENGIKVLQMTEEEKEATQRRGVERRNMMEELQNAFGAVVDAAVDGDFSQRVQAEFPDEELNRLASGVNNLVETVDRGVSETGQVLAALANTDLTKRMEGNYKGAFKKLQDDTNRVGEQLTDVVGKLRTTSRGLKTATGEILSGANDLSERTTRQAASIEETSASTEQLAETVRDNTERAQKAQVSANEARTVAERGGQVMSEANEAMQRITASSAKISDIIGMIDDIAFQTNLLALNASVEAARAGEAGKGFAVVAVEVRRLAQSAAEASSEVKVLIEQSGSEVDSGTKLVAQASQNLDGIVDSVRGVTALMDEIARESKEQSSSINDISMSIAEMDEMTQRNAALVEETNAAIEQTEIQANELDRIVDVFVTDNAARRSAPPAQSAPVEQPARGIKALQDKVASVARSYISNGNAAVDTDAEWKEF